MNMVPKDRKYTKEHEWVLVEGDIATIGVTDFAAGELGDIVFVELPGVGDELNQGDTVGSIESVKAVEDLYVPVSGEVVAINEEIDAAPETVNKEPFDGGWLLKIKLSDPAELDGLLDAGAYTDLLGG
ncbi:glycine cleavage system protein H [bacterium DOLJORAL78_65_58]|nr:MAG: glycine cleavage system protein H [bacterium DOLZORAL124_64_63]PIE76415.1 MAG: glycine cleavage system protein H [bacterium DOLJORAL78_65_58]